MQPITYPVSKDRRNFVAGVAKMPMFAAECPIEGCKFRKESHWRNAAKGGVILHIYRSEGKGHGPRGSRPEMNLEIKVRETGSE